jgi:hypothetical protein
MIVTKRVSVVLANGRAHVLRLPEGVDAYAAAEALCGLRSPHDVGWADGIGEWLQCEAGEGWVRRDAIAEVSVVDWVDTPTEIYT